MKVTGYYKEAVRPLNGKLEITLTINEEADAIAQINDMSKDKLMDIEVKPHREKRSIDANALLWACLSDIAKELRTDKWLVYLMMLKRYGKYTYIVIKPNAVEAMKAQWRECEEIGEIDIHGTKAVQMLCYFGSSTYDSKEFSVLLDGVISDMKNLGLQPPTPEDLRRSIEQWEKQHNATKSSNT